MPRLGLKFVDGPARVDRPVLHNLDELPETWHVVFYSNGHDKKTAVYERVDTDGDETTGIYRHVETLDEVRRNREG